MTRVDINDMRVESGVNIGLMYIFICINIAFDVRKYFVLCASGNNHCYGIHAVDKRDR